ncbi:MAG: hypothetical protein AAB547_01275 [Patescibacteria group bacterium]
MAISQKSRWIITFGMLILLSFVAYLVLQRMLYPLPQEGIPVSPSLPAASKKTEVSKTETVTDTGPAELSGDAHYQSENFRVGDIAIGGEAEFLLTENTPEPLKISAIRGETFIEKNKQEVKLVLNWKTNKLAKSEIRYSKGTGQEGKTASEEDYSLNHSLIIPGLDQASTYIYTIAAQDRFGNAVVSDPYAVYTGSRTVSLFDLIAGAIGDVFGWAVSR